MLVNLEKKFVFMLEIKSIPNYQQGPTVSAVRFNWGLYQNKLGKNEYELEVLILT